MGLSMCVCVTARRRASRPGVSELFGLDTFRTYNEEDVRCAAVDLGAALGF